MKEGLIVTTREELRQIVNEAVENALQSREPKVLSGLDGIKKLFGVCTATASAYKNSFLKEAITPVGQSFTIDVAKARELYANRKQIMKNR